MGHIDYRSFCDRDVHGLVRMWKESRSGWPPGFFGASDISASSVEQEEKSSGRLFSVIALEGERVVGFCRTCPYGGEPDASYVSLLNVVPDRHGLGIGKQLLLDSVARSAELGMMRIDLHTWPANMKAVPLYKKTGFFWVPETKVYMQNYMPFLLQMDDFKSFLNGDDWYGLFSRDLQVEPDLLRTGSGRKVFRYVFEREEDVFSAEFDRRGRCLSSISWPGFTAELTVDSGEEFFAGRAVELSLEGTGVSLSSASVSAAESLEWEETGDNCLVIKPLAVRVPRTTTEPADRLTVQLGELELGIGIAADEEVSLHNSAFRFLPAGAEKVSLGVRSLGNTASAAVTWSVDDGETMHRVTALKESTYQTMVLDIPPLSPGVHTMWVQVGRAGYREKVILVAGVPSGDAVSFDTRARAVIACGEFVLTVNRRGGYSCLYTRDDRGEAVQIGNFLICPGPPSWNSDLPLQRYDLEVRGGTVFGKTLWPSKPGLVYSFEAELHREGYARIRAFVENGSSSVHVLNFKARNSYKDNLEPKVDLLPLEEGLLRAQRIYNQIPDWEEDLPSSVSSLAAPWHGISGGGLSVMTYFSGWTGLEYDMAGTPDREVAPGDTLASPPLMVLAVRGDHRALLTRAEALGWETGNWHRKASFPSHDLKPVMVSGAEVTLTHPLWGERAAEVSCKGECICSGKVKNGSKIAGAVEADGVEDLELVLAGRKTVKPVFFVQKSSSAVSKREANGVLNLSGGRVNALIDPAACGQVFSLVLDGKEFLHSSRPEPSEFAWEKPWFGGIHPMYMGGRNNRPFPLEKNPPEVEECSRTAQGLRIAGWRMTWKLDDRHMGTVALQWCVWLLPGVPVLRTELHCVAPHGEYLDGELSVRGFLKPGGSFDEETLTCETFPGLVQGRSHAGAWVPAGSWGRVQNRGAFVEVYPGEEGKLLSDDYGENGCHFTQYTSHTRECRLDMDWLFGAVPADEALADVYRAHR